MRARNRARNVAGKHRRGRHLQRAPRGRAQTIASTLFPAPLSYTYPNASQYVLASRKTFLPKCLSQITAQMQVDKATAAHCPARRYAPDLCTRRLGLEAACMLLRLLAAAGLAAHGRVGAPVVTPVWEGVVLSEVLSCRVYLRIWDVQRMRDVRFASFLPCSFYGYQSGIGRALSYISDLIVGGFSPLSTRSSFFFIYLSSWATKRTNTGHGCQTSSRSRSKMTPRLMSEHLFSQTRSMKNGLLAKPTSSKMALRQSPNLSSTNSGYCSKDHCLWS